MNVVLMGPPGSGKSFIGKLLARAGVASYLELEPVLVSRFGSGDEFLRNKAAALAFIRASHIDQLERSTGRPVVLESTGISDRPLIDELRGRYPLRLVHVATPRATCLQRVASRPAHLNIRNDPEAAVRLHDFWLAEVGPSYAFALSVDGTDAPGACRDIAGLLQASEPQDRQ